MCVGTRDFSFGSCFTPALCNSFLRTFPLPFLTFLYYTSVSLGICTLVLKGSVFYSHMPLELHNSGEGEMVGIF